MPTLLNFDITDERLNAIFTTQIIALEVTRSAGHSNDFSLIKVTDGIVYYFNGVYAIGDLKNKIKEIIIIRDAPSEIVIIDTKKVSKSLVPLLESYVVLLNGVSIELAENGTIDIQCHEHHTVDDIREQIIIDNPKEITDEKENRYRC